MRRDRSGAQPAPRQHIRHRHQRLERIALRATCRRHVCFAAGNPHIEVENRFHGSCRDSRPVVGDRDAIGIDADCNSGGYVGVLAGIERVVDAFLSNHQRPVGHLVPGLRLELLGRAEVEQPAGPEGFAVETLMHGSFLKQGPSARRGRTAISSSAAIRLSLADDVDLGGQCLVTAPVPAVEPASKKGEFRQLQLHHAAFDIGEATGSPISDQPLAVLIEEYRQPEFVPRLDDADGIAGPDAWFRGS